MFWFIVLIIITALYGPHFYEEGSFGDGVTYACIARNMAVGKGSFWHPYFSSSFWLPYNITSVFYEHPPLMFWLESLLFRLIGDYYFIEKIYSFIIFLLTGTMVVQLWKLIFSDNQQMKKMSWCAIVIWITMPEVEWSTPNNMLDNTMGLFSVASAFFFIKGFQVRSVFNFTIASMLLLAAFISKGPIGLFPLILPLFYLLIFGKQYVNAMVKCYFIIITSIIIFCLYVYVDKSAYQFLTTYIKQQIVSGLLGNRELTSNGSKIDYLIIIANQLQNAFNILLILTIIWIIRNKLRLKHLSNSLKTKWILLMLLLGVSGSFPILLSSKQAGYYLIPCLPTYAIGLAIIMAHLLIDIFKEVTISNNQEKIIKLVLIIALLLINIYALSFISKKRNETSDLISDIYKIQPYLQGYQKVEVCKKLMADFNVHANFNRYLRVELSLDSVNTKFSILDSNCNIDYQKQLDRNRFKEIVLPTKRIKIYKKQPI